MSLVSLGWTDALASAFQPYTTAGLTPARVALQHKHAYELLAAPASALTDHPLLAFTAECTGKLLHAAASPSDLPAVGDWVAIRPRPGERHADIHAVLPRRTKFSRRAPGSDTAATEQIVATNVDVVFLVTALDQNFNLRRIERYLAAAWESGAQPVVVLNKADLHPDPAAAQAEVQLIAAGAPVVTLSAATLEPSVASTAAPLDYGTPERLAPWLESGTTVAFLGSSGVGKSTLINRLLGANRQRTNTTSAAVAKGRHTTTHRELILAPAGFLVIDTPGMRELQLWDTPEAAVDHTFADIAALVARCRFTDCSHRGEPGCAIQAALDSHALDFARWQSFQKLQREQAYAARKSDPALARETKNHWKKIHRAHRATQRFRREE